MDQPPELLPEDEDSALRCSQDDPRVAAAAEQAAHAAIVTEAELMHYEPELAPTDYAVPSQSQRSRSTPWSSDDEADAAPVRKAARFPTAYDCMKQVLGESLWSIQLHTRCSNVVLHEEEQPEGLIPLDVVVSVSYDVTFCCEECEEQRDGCLFFHSRPAPEIAELLFIVYFRCAHCDRHTRVDTDDMGFNTPMGRALHEWSQCEEHRMMEGFSATSPTVSDFNRFHFMVMQGARYVRLDPNTGTVACYNRQQFRELYQHVSRVVEEDSKPVQFIDYWMNSLNKRIYNSMQFLPPPLPCPPDVYNTWTPFAVEEMKGVCNQQGLNMYLAHVSVICNHKQESIDLLHNFWAHMYQKPGECAGVAPIFQSDPGSGKGHLIDIHRTMVGPSKALKENKPEYLFGTYNNNMDQCILCDIDDVREAAWTPQYMQALIHAVTEAHKGTTIRRMHQGPEKNVKVFARFILEGQWAVPIAASGRRFVAIRSSDEKNGDAAYFTELNRLFSLRSTMWAVYQWYMHRDISDVDFKAPMRCADTVAMARSSIDIHVRLLYCIARGPASQTAAAEPILHMVNGELVEEPAAAAAAGDEQAAADEQPLPDTIVTTSGYLQRLYKAFYQRWYTAADRSQTAADLPPSGLLTDRKLTHVLHEMAKHSIGDGAGVPLPSGLSPTQARTTADRRQLKGYLIDRGQMLQYMARRFNLSPELETDDVNLDEVADFSWDQLRVIS